MDGAIGASVGRKGASIPSGFEALRNPSWCAFPLSTIQCVVPSLGHPPGGLEEDSSPIC
jgi:hypothetical protein